MYVYCFTLHIPSNSNIDIDAISMEFGDNIPHYLALEGSSRQYLFCVDKSVDIVGICKNHGIPFESYNLTLMGIDDAKYNNNYTIFPSYAVPRTKSYTLELIK